MGVADKSDAKIYRNLFDSINRVVMIFKYGFAPSFNKVFFVFQICTRFLSIVVQFLVERSFCHKLGFNEKPFI